MSVYFVTGSSQYIDLASPATLDNVWAGGGSFAGWVLNNQPGGQTAFIGKGVSTSVGGSGWMLSVTSGGSVRFRHSWSVAVANYTVPGLIAGEWHHLVMLYDKTTAGVPPAFYVDGVSVAATEVTASSGAAADDNAQDIWLARGYVAGTQGFFMGELEDMRLFNGRTLNEKEIALLASGYRGPVGGESGWWALDTGLVVPVWDETVLGAGNRIPDLSGNGNIGTPTNSPVGRASRCPRMWVRPSVY